MDVLRFIKWWWDKKSTSDRLLYCLSIWCALLFPGLYFLELKAFLIWILGIIFCVLCFLGRWILLSIKKQWSLFQIEREYEAHQIIVRLGGKPVELPLSTKVPGFLAAMRARSQSRRSSK